MKNDLVHGPILSRVLRHEAELQTHWSCVSPISHGRIVRLERSEEQAREYLLGEQEEKTLGCSHSLF